MSRPRDSQRSAAYDAEDRVFEGLGDTRAGQVLGEAQVNSRLAEIAASRWWADRVGAGYRPHVVVSPQKKPGNAHVDGHMIVIPKAGIRHWVLLHELAHWIVMWAWAKNAPAHGQEWARIYAGLVSRFLGRDLAKALRQSFDDHRVKWRKPHGPRKPLTVAQKAALTARLKKGR